MDENRNLSPIQRKKLAIHQQHDSCYIVLEGNRYYCLTHAEYTNNKRRCSHAKRKGS